MNFIIKSFKENILINLSIIFCFLVAFYLNDMKNINRYFDGYKYKETLKTFEVIFLLKPKLNFFLYPSAILLEKEVDEYFDEYITNVKSNSIKYSFKLTYSIKFSDENIDNAKKKINEFNKYFIKTHKKKMNDLYSLNLDDILEIDKNNLFIDKIKQKENIDINDFYFLKLDSVKFFEELKLGQKKKILLSKLIIGNLFFSLLSSILFCLIISIIKSDIYKLKNKKY